MDPSITVFDYKHERVTEGIVQEIRVKNLDVGNGVGTVAFMSEDSVTEFHGSHEWAQGRKFLKLQFSCRGRRGKLTELILENTFLDSFKSIFPNRGHYVYLVNKAQPLQEIDMLACVGEAEGEQVVQDRSVRTAVERAVEREIEVVEDFVQQIVQDLSVVQRAVRRVIPRLASAAGYPAAGPECPSSCDSWEIDRHCLRPCSGDAEHAGPHVCSSCAAGQGIPTPPKDDDDNDDPWVDAAYPPRGSTDAADDGIAPQPRHERINYSQRAHRFPSAVERAVERNIPQLI
jgi:hypothetical protein